MILHVVYAPWLVFWVVKSQEKAFYDLHLCPRVLFAFFRFHFFLLYHITSNNKTAPVLANKQKKLFGWTVKK